MDKIEKLSDDHKMMIIVFPLLLVCLAIMVLIVNSKLDNVSNQLDILEDFLKNQTNSYSSISVLYQYNEEKGILEPVQFSEPKLKKE